MGPAKAYLCIPLQKRRHNHQRYDMGKVHVRIPPWFVCMYACVTRVLTKSIVHPNQTRETETKLIKRKFTKQFTSNMHQCHMTKLISFDFHSKNFPHCRFGCNARFTCVCEYSLHAHIDCTIFPFNFYTTITSFLQNTHHKFYNLFKWENKLFEARMFVVVFFSLSLLMEKNTHL